MIVDPALTTATRPADRRHPARRAVMMVPLLALLLGSSARAQSSASIAGTVTDTTGLPLPGVTVRVEKTGYGAITNSRGRFTINGITPGSHTLTVSSTGHAPQERVVRLEPGGTLSADFVLVIKPLQSGGVEVVAQSDARIKRNDPIKIEVIDLRGVQTRTADVAQMLSRSPGTHIRQEGGLGSSATININGLQGKAVRLFLDDIPVDYLGRAFDLSLIPVNTLDRIEVYKGVMPVSLGADALGGGINFVSKGASDRLIDVSYEYGSFNTHRATLNARYADTATHIFAGLNGYFNTSDNNYLVDANLVDSVTAQRYPARVPRFHDRARSYFAEVSAGVESVGWADLLKVGIAYSDFRKDFQNGALMTAPYGEAFGRESGIIPSLRYTKTFGGTLTADLFLTRSWLHAMVIDTSSRKYGWDGTVISDGHSEGEINAFKTNEEMHWTHTLGRTYLRWDLAEGEFLDLGYDYIREDRQGSNPTGPKSVFTDVDPLTVPAFYTKQIAGASYSIEIPGLPLTNVLAVKYFGYSASGNDAHPYGSYDTLPRTQSGGRGGISEAVKYALGSDLLLRASYEYANRLPDRDELFGDGMFILSNFSLAPEQSHNVNVGGRYNGTIVEGTKLLVETNLFYRRATGLIATQPQGPFSIYKNVNEAHIKGIEGDVSVDFLDHFTLGGNVTYQDLRRTNVAEPSESYLENSRIPNIPYFFYNLGARFHQKDLLIGGSSFELYWDYGYVHEFYLYGIARELEPASLWDEANVSTDLVIPTQSIHSAGFSFSFPGDRLSLAFEASNIFDTKTYDNFKIQKPGRTLHLKLRSLIR